MRPYYWMIQPALLFAAFPASPAEAATAINPAPFAAVAVPDEVLAGQRAGSGITFGPTKRTMQSVTNDQARLVERLTAGVARISMDVWWGSVGSEMIAVSVRAAEPGQ